MVIIQIRFLTNPFCAFQIHNLFVDKIMHIIHIRCTNFHCGEKAKAMRLQLPTIILFTIYSAFY